MDNFNYEDFTSGILLFSNVLPIQAVGKVTVTAEDTVVAYADDAAYGGVDLNRGTYDSVESRELTTVGGDAYNGYRRVWTFGIGRAVANISAIALTNRAYAQNLPEDNSVQETYVYPPMEELATSTNVYSSDNHATPMSEDEAYIVYRRKTIDGTPIYDELYVTAKNNDIRYEYSSPNFDINHNSFPLEHYDTNTSFKIEIGRAHV